MNPTPRQIKNLHRKQGVTLIELLIVVSIVVVLTAVLIPRLRIVNQERAIRETARTVASLFVSARERAIDEGIAGVLIERNTNFVDPDTGVLFAGTRMFLMRTPAPYSGDDIFSRATVTTPSEPFTMLIQIPEPLEQDDSNPPIVQPNDEISLNFSSVRYRISDVTESTQNNVTRLDLTLDLEGGALPALPESGTGTPGIPFLIFRQPERLESSRVDLPSGFMVDLRFSGPLAPLGVTVSGNPNDVPAGTFFNQAPMPVATPPAPDDIRFFFNNRGTLDRVVSNDPSGLFDEIPIDSLFLLIASVETDITVNPILQDSNLWMTMDRSSGAVNVASNAPPSLAERQTFTPVQIVQRARQVATTQQSANQ